MTAPRLTLFHDGLCPLCSREIEYYRRKAAGLDVVFVDIADPAFDAAAHGLDPDRVHRQMHVKLGDTVLTGVEAFTAIWRTLPGFRWLAASVQLPGIHLAARIGYWAFATVRPWLPRRTRTGCETGTCGR